MSQPTLSPLAEISTELRSWSLRATVGAAEWLFVAEHFAAQPEMVLEAPLTLAAEGARRTLSGRFGVLICGNAPGLDALLEAVELGSSEAAGELFIADGELLSRGVLTAVRRSGAHVELRFESGLPHGTKAICRNARAIPELATPKTNRFLPQIFGQGDVMAVPLFELEESALRDALANDAVSLRLVRPVDWPPTGRLQIDDEVIQYEGFVAGSDSIGSEAHPLSRPKASEHRSRARVVRLPAALEWCVADHAATVMEIRGENESGAPVVGGVVAQRTLDGLPCTTFRAAQLPVVVTPGRTATTRETVRSSAQWAILQDTTAVESGDAFNVSSPGRGAILSGPGPTIAANYVQDLTRESGRFDELRGVALGFEFSDTPGWGAATRLRVRIRKGPAVAEVLVDRDGVVIPVPVKGVALVPSPHKSLSRAESRVLFFDRVMAEGPWVAEAAAIDGGFQGAATVTSPTEPCALTATFVRARPEFDGMLLSIILRARLRNAAPTATDARLVFALGARMEESATRTLAVGEVADISMGVAIPGDVTAAEVFADGRFRLEIPASAMVEVEEFWLEARAAVAIIAGLPEDLVQLPLVAAAAQGVRITYNEVALDVTALLPAEPWQFFSVDGGTPQVEIALVDPPQDADWSVFLRDVHWKLTVIPATGARPVERLWARVRGRAARVDGTANPADVAAILLGDEAFARVPPGSRDEASFAAAAATCTALKLGLQAVHQSATPLAEVFGRVLAEGLLVAGMARGKWSLWTAPVQLESTLPPAFPPLELMESDAAEEFAPRAAAPAPEPTMIVAGRDVVSRHFAARGRAGWDTEARADARMAALLPGMAFAFAGGWLAELEAVRLRAGALSLRLGARRRVADAYNTNLSRVRRCLPTHDVLFFLGPVVVAKLTAAGDLLLRGTVREATLAMAPNPTLVVYHPGQPLLAINFCRNSTDYSAVALDSAGNLLTSLPIREQAAIADPAPAGVGAMSLVASLLGGAPGGAAAMRLDAAAFALRGRILTQRDL